MTYSVEPMRSLNIQPDIILYRYGPKVETGTSGTTIIN